MKTRFQIGDEVRVIRPIRNDGTFPGMNKGQLLIRRGSVGVVEDIGTFLTELKCMPDRRACIEPPASVRKRIRRGVDDAHDERPCQGETVRTGVENGHKNRGA